MIKPKFRILITIAIIFIFNLLPFRVSADIKTAVVQTAVNTATGNQTFSTTQNIGTPKAALFFITQATANDTVGNHARMGVGTADASAEWAVCNASAHAQNPTVALGRGMTDKCICIYDLAGAIDAEADWVSFTDKSVTINWTAAPASAYLMTVVLFAGSDLSVDVGTMTTFDVLDAERDVTVGFEPDQVIVMSRLGIFSDSNRNAYQYGLGFADNDQGASPYPQGSVNVYDRHNVTPSEAAIVTTDHYVQWKLTNASAGAAMEIDNFDANGFSIFTREAANGFTVGYLALAYGSVTDHTIKNFDSATATGNQSVTGIGFQPQLVLQFLSDADTIDTHLTDADGGFVGISAFTPNDEYVNTNAWEDAKAASNTQSLVDNIAVQANDDTGVDLHVATFVSMDSDGWTLNYTTANATARKWTALAIERGPLRGAVVVIP